MNEFVEECRREWRRLGVADPIANEMAADLMADLDEAEAEGGSAEDVLGNSAFDPRRFAASWAAARGVTAPPPPPAAPRRPPLVLAIALTAVAAVAVVAALGIAAVLLFRRSSAAAAFPFHRMLGGPGPVRFFASGPFLGPGRIQAVEVLAVIVLVGAVVGVVGLGLALLYWSPWSWSSRRRRTTAR